LVRLSARACVAHCVGVVYVWYVRPYLGGFGEPSCQLYVALGRMPVGIRFVESLYSVYASGLFRKVVGSQVSGCPAAGIWGWVPKRNVVAWYPRPPR
jgi:hypothetical protein